MRTSGAAARRGRWVVGPPLLWLALFFLAPWMTSECIDFVNLIFEKVSQVPIT